MQFSTAIPHCALSSLLTYHNVNSEWTCAGQCASCRTKWSNDWKLWLTVGQMDIRHPTAGQLSVWLGKLPFNNVGHQLWINELINSGYFDHEWMLLTLLWSLFIYFLSVVSPQTISWCLTLWWHHTVTLCWLIAAFGRLVLKHSFHKIDV